MSAESATLKAYEQKISAQLQQAKAQLEELEARAKGKTAQAEINLIKDMKSKQQEIHRKLQELKTVGDAKHDQIKSEIDAHLANLKSRLMELSNKFKAA